MKKAAWITPLALGALLGASPWPSSTARACSCVPFFTEVLAPTEGQTVPPNTLIWVKGPAA